MQPCGHKAREKGVLIKVFTSCQSTEIPTEYCYTVSGTNNDKNTGMMVSYRKKQLLETQTTDSVDSSVIRCNSKTIDEPCTLYIWKELERVSIVCREDRGEVVRYYDIDEDRYGWWIRGSWGVKSPQEGGVKLPRLVTSHRQPSYH